MTARRRLHFSLIMPLAGALLLAAGCGRIAHDQAEIRYATATGDFDVAEQRLNDIYNSQLPNDPGADGRERLHDKHGLLWTLDRGIISYMRGDYATAAQLLNEASNLVEHFRTRWRAGNISRQIAAGAINETLTEYDGKAHEHVQVEFWRSLNELVQAQRLYGILPSALAPDQGAANQHLQNSISYARRMVLNQIQEGQDAADSTFWRRTYYDDPFARLFSAALMLTPPRDQRAQSDMQFANVMLQRSWQAYREERGKLAGQRHWRYEVPQTEHIQPLVTLLHRVGHAYDPQGWSDWVQRNNVPAPQPIRLGDAEPAHPSALPDGYGMVLVINKADLVTIPESLDIYVAAGTIPGRYTRVRNNREQVRTFSIGALSFAARGPGAYIVNDWPVIPVPGQITQAMAPGGIAIMGTSIPVHAPDAPMVRPPQIMVESGDTAVSADLRVLADIDAYARATLKDEQPRTLMRALLRTAIKQTAGAVATEAIRRETGALGGLVAGLLISGGLTMSEVADVRAPLLLPNTVQGVLLDVPAGTHRFQLLESDAATDLGAITVPEGRLVVVPVRSFPTIPDLSE